MTQHMKVIYCAGEQGRVVLDILKRTDEDEHVVFLDDDPSYPGWTVDGIEVAGTGEALTEMDPEHDRCIVAFGDEQGTRIALAERVREAGIELFSAVDTDTTLAETADVGEGVIVNARTYVGPGAHLDDLVLVDSAVSVSHDVHLARGATVGPGVTLAGGVTVGEDAYVGAGATVLDDRTIGERAVIGAGAVVVNDVPSETTVVGVPAGPTGSRQGDKRDRSP